jgi:hypothetical protein
VSTLTSSTLMMSIQAVHAEIVNLRISVDGELENLEPDDQEMLFAYSKAAMELKQLYLSALEQEHGLPPYEDLAPEPAPPSR